MSTSTDMTHDEKVAFLEKHGWHTWYNDNYWVNPKIVDEKKADYTNFGMDIESAIKCEKNFKGPLSNAQIAMGSFKNACRGIHLSK